MKMPEQRRSSTIQTDAGKLGVTSVRYYSELNTVLKG